MQVRDKIAGVTLLETLIALVMMAFLAVILTSGLGMGAHVMRRSGDVTDEIDQAIGRFDLRKGLERSLAAPFADEIGGGLSGTASEITFFSFPDDGEFWQGTAVKFTVQNAAQFGVKAELSGLSAIGQREITRNVVIAPAGTTLAISYWGRAAPQEMQMWHKTWSADAVLPELVKFTFFRTAPAPPPMVVRPGKMFRQSEMSLSSLLPPALPSRP